MSARHRIHRRCVVFFAEETSSFRIEDSTINFRGQRRGRMSAFRPRPSCVSNCVPRMRQAAALEFPQLSNQLRFPLSHQFSQPRRDSIAQIDD